MAGVGHEKTALGIARERFLDALPRKSKELKGSVAALIASPDVARLREEMRRRLHALYASAQVFHEEDLAKAVKRAINCIDRARDEQRPLNQFEMDTLTELAVSIPSLGSKQTGVPSLLSRFSAFPSIIKKPVTPNITIRGDAPPSPFTAPQRRSLSEIPEIPDTEILQEAAEEVLSRQVILSVLVIENSDIQAEIRGMLPTEQFEVLSTDNPEEGLRLARSSAPDIVLANQSIILLSNVDFMWRLRSDPLTDFVPVISILLKQSPDDETTGHASFDDSLAYPFDSDLLIRTIVKHVETPYVAKSALQEISEATVDDVAERVSREIRRGLSESLRTSRDQKIPLGDSPEILAATWSTIGRIRSHLSHRSGGSVKFRDLPVRGVPALLALSDLDDGTEIKSKEGDLAGKRILVADDDPSVVWFFSSLLSEEKAMVFEAKDGKEALEIARNKRPDLLISDILMPEIDGYTLCRELKKDILLADVPVILISWKEDFIQRMRDLSSGANGYLRKEAPSRKILDQVYRVLRPRMRLEAELRIGAEVRGKVEGIGILNLLEIVAKERPDSRITMRDARNLFELDIRNGNPVALTQTASDGSFLRGERALRQLLGAKSGRYGVVESKSPVRHNFKASLHKLLRDGTNQLGALLDVLASPNLMQVTRIGFNQELLDSILEISPESAREIVSCLIQGDSPEALIANGRFSSHGMEFHLEDLARRGAIVEVLGKGGKDLVAGALKTRQESPGTLLHSTPPPKGTDEQPDFLAVVPAPAMVSDLSSTPPAEVEESSFKEEGEALRKEDKPFDANEQNEADQWQEVDEESSRAAGRKDDVPIEPAVQQPKVEASAKDDLASEEKTDSISEDKGLPPPHPTDRAAMKTDEGLDDSEESSRKNMAFFSTDSQERENRLSSELSQSAKELGLDSLVPSTSSDRAQEIDGLQDIEQDWQIKSTPSEEWDKNQSDSKAVSIEATVSQNLVEAIEAATQPEAQKPEELPTAKEERASQKPEVPLTAKEEAETQKPEELPAAQKNKEVHKADKQPAEQMVAPSAEGDVEQQAELKARTSQPEAAHGGQVQKPAPEVPHPNLSVTQTENFTPQPLVIPVAPQKEVANFQRSLTRGKSRGVGLFLLFGLILILGVVGFSVLRTQDGESISDKLSKAFSGDHEKALTEPSKIDSTAVRKTIGKSDKQPADTPEAQDKVDLADRAQETAEPQEDGFGRLLPFIDQSRNVEVHVDQGLLVIEFEGQGKPPFVTIGGRRLGRAPINVALSAGRHEVVFERNNESSYRYVVIRTGKTLVVQSPYNGGKYGKR